MSGVRSALCPRDQAIIEEAIEDIDSIAARLPDRLWDRRGPLIDTAARLRTVLIWQCSAGGG